MDDISVARRSSIYCDVWLLAAAAAAVATAV